MATSPAAPGGRLILSRRRKIAYAAAALVLFSSIALLVLVAADVYAHTRVEDVAGVNIWGYRGAPVGRRQPGETRIVMLGGSTAFGWGVPARESIPAFLERRLAAEPPSGGRRLSVINLGAPGQGAHGFVFDLEDFHYLDYDIVILYEGYNDVGLDEAANRRVPNFLLWRRSSPVFRASGYYPILPVVLREKATLMTTGVPDGLGREQPIAFQAGLAARATGGALRAAASAGEQVARQLGRFTDAAPAPVVEEGCVERWKQYCGAVRDAVQWSLDHGKAVVFVTQPYAGHSHVEQQANAIAMLTNRFGKEARLRMVNLGTLIDLHDASVAYDGLHLVAAGNDLVASHLVTPVLELLGNAQGGAR